MRSQASIEGLSFKLSTVQIIDLERG